MSTVSKVFVPQQGVHACQKCQKPIQEPTAIKDRRHKVKVEIQKDDKGKEISRKHIREKQATRYYHETCYATR